MTGRWATRWFRRLYPFEGPEPARRAAGLYIFFATILSLNQFSDALLGIDGVGRLQQYVAVILAAIVGAFLVVPTLRFLRALRFHRRWLPYLVFAAVVGLYAYTALSTFWSSQPELASRKAIAFLVTSFAAAACAIWLNARQAFSLFCVGLAILLLVSALFWLDGTQGVYVQAWTPTKYMYKGLFSQKNGMASAASLATVMMLALWASDCVRLRWFLTVAAIAIPSVVAASSTGGVLLLMVGPLLVLATLRAWWLDVTGLLVTGAACVLALAVWAGLHVGIAGNELVLGPLRLDANGRFDLWRFGLEQIHGNWFFGTGLMGFWTETRIAAFADASGFSVSNIHNSYMHVLVEGGAVGLTLFLLMVALAVLLGRNLLGGRFSVEARLCLVLMLSLLMYSLYQYYLMRGTQFTQLLFTYAVMRLVIVASGVDNAAPAAEGRDPSPSTVAGVHVATGADPR